LRAALSKAAAERTARSEKKEPSRVGSRAAKPVERTFLIFFFFRIAGGKAEGFRRELAQELQDKSASLTTGLEETEGR